MEEKFRIRKINIASLIYTLQDLYDKGVNFIDISAEMENGQDTIGMYFCRSYMNEEFENNFDAFKDDQAPAKIGIKLSDEDLNQLL